jgi:hypothetical protein
MHSPDVGNILGGYTLQPDASNTLGGYAYMLTLAFTLFTPGVSNMLGSCRWHLSARRRWPYTALTPVCTIDTFRPDTNDFTSRRLRSVVFDSCHLRASDTNLFAYNDQKLGGSITTSPLMIHGTASARLHHHGDSATMRLHRRGDSTAVSTSFCVLPHDIQDCDFKARFESLPDSTIRLDTRGLLMRTWPIESSPLAYPLSAKEKAYSKDTRSPQGPTCRLGVEGKKLFVNPNWLHI